MSGPVLIFDSGVGGLSVAAALRRHFPEAALCYACDNAWLPYGLRPDAALVRRIVATCKAAVEACRPAVLVVACNTASTLALEPLRAALEVPVVGTVPAIKPAAALSRTRHLGLLATSATVRRPYTRRLIERFAADCRVTCVAADALVGEAEAWLGGREPDAARLDMALASLWQAARLEAAPLDTVVLGCTHFPLLTASLSALAPTPLAWIDSGDAIARRVGQLVAPLTASGGRPGPGFATAPNAALAYALAAYGFGPPAPLALADAATH
ncbi:glutamate racemase [Halomonas piscis]|uniref:Glutamate racemase n=1 Tax=Halomonas piscis TaxID=3031727 RepID=A0ABY9YZ97_9GAMM|nr:glutamate racemase [Halomonas piscis]WNK19384.1 glutamate racemase [Halomonas piscis]